ncbi:hypothetical protein CGK38_03280 [Vibrio parahaemolyticus]|nr:hypothetical protein CGK38_03280 [Vibrio parahaemolyticus]
MKDIYRSIKENATSRLKNPVIGAFVLSWTVLHLNGVGLFFLVDNDTKIKMIHNKAWELFGDFLIPLGIAVCYLITLPLLNMAYEFMNEGLVNFNRTIQKHSREEKLAKQKKKTVVAEVECDVAYIQKLKDKEIDGWLEQQAKRNREFIDIKERYAGIVAEARKDRSKLLKELKEKKSDFSILLMEKSDLEKDLHKKKLMVESTINQLELLLKKIENRNDLALTRDDIVNIQAYMAEFRGEFDVWDEDIPF